MKKKKERVDWKIVTTAIISLTILEVVALLNGINGKILSFSIAIIAGLAGWTMPQLKIKQKV